MTALRILVLVLVAGLLGVVGCSLPATGKVPASSPLRPFEAPDEDDLVAEDEDDYDDVDLDDEDAAEDATDAADGEAGADSPATQPAADATETR